MKSLIDQIKKAAEFNQEQCFNKYAWHNECSVGELPTLDASIYSLGARHQHAQNAWAFEALGIAIEALNEYDSYNKLALDKIAALVPGGEK